MYSARTCDFGITRSATIYGRGIRFMTSRGMHRAWGNHNFPIWEDPESGMLMTLQIETPKARIVTLREYLEDTYEKGGRVIVCRPDLFTLVAPSPEKERHLRMAWVAMAGTKYDKKSIWQILKMYCRIRKHIPENTKEHVYCTEGTFAPYMDEQVGWIPDQLRNESYPTPIHSEHMLRQGRVEFVGGGKDVKEKILRLY